MKRSIGWALGVCLVGGSAYLGLASSHREAPLISADPLADNTDTYAFVSPDVPDTVTLIANWIPLEAPGGGPNFYKFGDDVLYRINVDNNGDAKDDIVYEFRFKTRIQNKATFLSTPVHRLARRSEFQHAPDLHGHADRSPGPPRPRRQPGHAAGERRVALDTKLRDARRRRHPHTLGRLESVCRPA